MYNHKHRDRRKLSQYLQKAPRKRVKKDVKFVSCFEFLGRAKILQNQPCQLIKINETIKQINQEQVTKNFFQYSTTLISTRLFIFNSSSVFPCGYNIKRSPNPIHESRDS